MSHWTTRERLMRQVDRETVRARAAVAICAAGMLVVVLLAALGAGSGDERILDRTARSGANGTVAQSNTRAEMHRKRVFEERRERFFQDHGATKSATNEVER